MSEPGKYGRVWVSGLEKRASAEGKTRAQLNRQIDRIYNATQEALNGLPKNSPERQRIYDRYARVGDIYNQYLDNMNTSRRMDSAIRKYHDEVGTYSGVSGYIDDVVIPRSQYMRRRNNRR